jgi:hypothetical protein
VVVDLEQLLAALADEILPEAVAAEHLEQETAEVAEPLLSELQKRPALAAQDTCRRERGPGSTATKDRAHAVPLKCSREALPV